MAKVNIEVDTSAKTVNMVVDGQTLSNVKDIMIFYNEDAPTDSFDRLNMDIRMIEKMEDMRKVTKLVAKDLTQEKGLSAHSDFKDFLVSDSKSVVEEEIQEYFS